MLNNRGIFERLKPHVTDIVTEEHDENQIVRSIEVSPNKWLACNSSVTYEDGDHPYTLIELAHLIHRNFAQAMI